MAQKISQMTEQTTASMTEAGTSDFLGGYTATGGSANRKFSLSGLANYFLNKFKMTLGGSSQTVKSAIDALNSKFIVKSTGSLHDIKSSGVYYLTGGVTDKPTGNGGYYSVSVFNNDLLVGTYISTDNFVFAVKLISGTWTYTQLGLKPEQTYNSGETIYVGGNNAMYAGRIGWGGNEIWFNIPIDKPVASSVGNTATITLKGYIYACTSSSAVQINNYISQATCYVGGGGRNFFSIKFDLSSNPLQVNDASLNIMFSGTLSEVVLP